MRCPLSQHPLYTGVVAWARRAPAPIVVIAALAGFVAASAFFEWGRREPSVPSEVADTKWHEEHIGMRVAFDAPSELHSAASALAPELADVVSTQFLTNDRDGLVVGAFASSIRVGQMWGLDDAAEGALANLRSPPGTLSVEPTRHDGTVFGVRAIELDALIRRDHADSLRFRGVAFVLGQELYVISMIARADQVAATAAWRRLRNSIRAR
jgi:hypothetical protein